MLHACIGCGHNQSRQPLPLTSDARQDVNLSGMTLESSAVHNDHISYSEELIYLNALLMKNLPGPEDGAERKSKCKMGFTSRIMKNVFNAPFIHLLIYWIKY